jgi:cation transport ATPase
MIAEDFVDLAMTIRAARDGILLANASSLAALSTCDCLILDDSVAWSRQGLETASFAKAIHEHGISEIAFLSSSEKCTVSKSSFDIIRSDFTTEEKRAYIAQRQHFDHTVAYIGNCQTEAPVAAQADLAISVLTPPHVTPHGTQAALLGADMVKILRLLELVKESRAEFGNAFGISLVPNVASMIGALYFNAHVETSVILSNLGTLVNYARYRSLLHLNLGR